ncbi:hypothetical protein [Photobacterium marinum]|uniref:hypothetical protein n=1 Tax=Photobacterium marinum TaxID=1056511 RepID=UPI0012F7F1B4|nr:hypothetical protein [Photobacterium marinum]
MQIRRYECKQGIGNSKTWEKQHKKTPITVHSAMGVLVTGNAGYAKTETKDEL